jgi:4-coumarate--CoA ligase
VDVIPKSVSGKIMRRQLKDEFMKKTKTAAA